jgi:hypothetical protein
MLEEEYFGKTIECVILMANLTDDEETYSKDGWIDVDAAAATHPSTQLTYQVWGNIFSLLMLGIAEIYNPQNMMNHNIIILLYLPFQTSHRHYIRIHYSCYDYYYHHCTILTISRSQHQLH